MQNRTGRTPNPKVAVFHPGTQHSWQTALALQNLGMLEWYATSILYQHERWPYRLERIPGPLGRRFHAEFRRFVAPPLEPARIRTHGLHEWAERIAQRLGLPRLAAGIDRRGNEQFVNGLARSIKSERQFTLWGYNGSSRSSFRLGKQYERICILDRTTGDWRGYNR